MSGNPPQGPIPPDRLTAGSAIIHPSPSDPLGPEAALDFAATRLLVVDDDPEVLKMVARMAACLGFHPTTARNARDALLLLNQAAYDLVLTDYRLPVMDGYQLADRIKQAHPCTKVVVMTGHCETACIDMLRRSGVVDGLLLKPFSLQIMREKLLCLDLARMGCRQP